MTLKAYFKEVKAHFNFASKHIVINDYDEATKDHTTFVILEDSDTGKELYNLQINSEHNCSVFRDLTIWNNLLVIGFDNYCYIFNPETEKTVCHKLKSYYDSFFTTNTHVYVSSSSFLNCFNTKAELVWRSEKLATDTVKVQKVENGIVYGSGKWADKGWVEFQIPLSRSKKQTYKKSILSVFFSLFKK